MIVPVPHLPLPREFAAFMEQAEKAKSSLKVSFAALATKQKVLMNESFKDTYSWSHERINNDKQRD